ncbi:BspA family leucine-rich repeat surface protein [Xylocopilactobacillus apicola]|uniref:Mub B2-like domain-containing protein n=1 Tax=Xylocopilactobacillus apicola TaxID=2932184 RepID=A0AAU9DDF5_9LACO|nr:BspA family leucine-rich repeat surface protein [Xylocopilactobacillus apicola]BDR59620.1 hypothetical protein XA3_20610 [Xylocopilactobacillus apicola]
MSLKNTFGIGLLGLTCPLVLMSQQVKADNVAPATEAISSEAKPQDLNRISIGNFGASLIKSGTWGTSKWDYVQDGNDYVLKFHAGTLAEGSICNINYNDDRSKLTRIEFDKDVVAAEDSSKLFNGLSRLKKIDGLNNLDTTNVTSMASMFAGCASLTTLDLSNFKTSNVRRMSDMFSGCQSLMSLDLSSFNTARVSNMHGMFAFCYFLENLSLKNFNTTKVVDMAYMFHRCNYLTELDLSSFNTSNVTNMESMFFDCNTLTSLDLKSFKLTKLNNMSYMFRGCDNLTSLDIRNFDKALNSFDNIFAGAINLNHIVLGPRTRWGSNVYLPVPEVGTEIPGTDKVVASQTWVATKGYSKGSKYTPQQLVSLTGRDQVTTYDWDSGSNDIEPDYLYEYKTITRTINLHQPDYSVKTDKQEAKIQRTVSVNPDGSLEHGPWSTSQWEQYNVPVIPGYEATQTSVPVQTINESTNDSSVDVYYDLIERLVLIKYFNGDQQVGEQRYVGYIDDVIIPRYRAPRGYDIISNPQALITVDGTNNQVIKVNVKPHTN